MDKVVRCCFALWEVEKDLEGKHSKTKNCIYIKNGKMSGEKFKASETIFQFNFFTLAKELCGTTCHVVRARVLRHVTLFLQNCIYY